MITSSPRPCLPDFASCASKDLSALFQFPPDMAPLPMPPNRLNDQVLVRLYDQDWKDISH